MKPVCKILTIAFITIWNLSVYGISPDKDDSLRVEVLLGSKMLEDIQMDVTFINSLNVTSNRHILLSSTNQFYLLG
ncbi:MAG: hypothetical protein HGB12_18025, partial [Bacteroidetes bacterium]|nr:hypothetical protein [Bacteroidota bacterium]